jgi:spore germination protein KC
MLFGLTGCWSVKELTDIAIVSALGIDRTEDGYKVSVQIINPGEIAAKKGGGGLGMSVFDAEGRSVAEAVRKLTTVTPRKPYLSHLRVVILGEELAKAGIRKPLDFLSREHEMRTDYVITIAKGMKAEDQLKVLTPMEKISANKIFSSIETAEQNWAPTKIVLLDELISSMVSDGKEPVITGLEIIGNPETGSTIDNIQRAKAGTIIKSDFLGVLKDDKLIDWLDESESKGFNYITDNINQTVGFMECDGGGTITIETIRSKTDRKGTIKNGKPKININVMTEANISDVECPVDLSKSETIKDIENEMNKKTEEIILSSVEKAKKLNSDIFGFGEVIGRAEPKKWEDLKKNWDEEFRNTDVEVKADIKIRRTGTISESFQEEKEE